MPRKPRPRCVGLDRKGEQCGHRSHDGLAPPLCRMHRAISMGTLPPGVATQFKAAPKTAKERIEKISSTDGHQAQMQALKLLLDMQQQDDTPRDPQRYRDFNLRATLAQWEQLRELTQAKRELFDLVSTQAMRDDDGASGEALLRDEAELRARLATREALHREALKQAPPVSTVETEDVQDAEEFVDEDPLTTP